MSQWADRLGISLAVLINSSRAALAGVASLLLARALRLPEFYWAPISAMVVLLSTVNPLTVAWQRFAGTALGAALGAMIATWFHPARFYPTWFVYGLGIFACGIFSALLRIGNAYRFAAITLSIVLLINHSRPPWIVAANRFIEVALGIAVALAVTLVWRAPAEEPAIPSGKIEST
jgi:uncharacterized membrane protein YccC